MDVPSFIDQQLAQWPEVRSRFDGLAAIRQKTVIVNGVPVQVQYNPGRTYSVAAKVDSLSISKRPCFLCASNRPKEQITLLWKTYQVLINPYPILPQHLTIAAKKHSLQAIHKRVADMLALAKWLKNFIVLYNGPACGASAPDHFHFQAVAKGYTPLETIVDKWSKQPASSICGKTAIRKRLCFSGQKILISGYEPIGICDAFAEVSQTFGPQLPLDMEPPMNIICSYTAGFWHLLVIPRRKHRPDCFFAEGDAQMIVSPGVIDMAGIIITPREIDFERITASDVEQIYHEVAFFES